MSSLIRFNHRQSDSSCVTAIWQAISHEAGEFISVAYPHWEIVVSRLNGEVTITVRGPETRATQAWCPPEGTWVGIRFKVGVSLPMVSNSSLVDNSITLPSAGCNSFWLNGALWEAPTLENADEFVSRLAREGLLARDSVVEDAILNCRANHQSKRTLQRRFQSATGLSYNQIRITERAHAAAFMLREGASINDTVVKLGFSDQSHLTRSTRYLLGQTPKQLMNPNCGDQLSFMPEQHLKYLLESYG